MLAALSPSLAWLTAARVLQGAGCAAGMVVGRAMVQDLFTGAERTRVMAYVGMAMGLIPPTATILGGQIHVPTLNGKAEIELPEGTQHGKTFRLRGKGIKGMRSSYPGDLYCQVAVETPIKLTEHQRKLLKELDESLRKGGDRHSPNAMSWTDRVKNLFK